MSFYRLWLMMITNWLFHSIVLQEQSIESKRSSLMVLSKQQLHHQHLHHSPPAGLQSRFTSNTTHLHHRCPPWPTTNHTFSQGWDISVFVVLLLNGCWMVVITYRDGYSYRHRFWDIDTALMMFFCLRCTMFKINSLWAWSTLSWDLRSKSGLRAQAVRTCSTSRLRLGPKSSSEGKDRAVWSLLLGERPLNPCTSTSGECCPIN